MSAQSETKQRHSKGKNISGLIPWKPGQSGNPAGRTPIKRPAVTAEFLSDTLDAWREVGRAAFLALAKENPHEYLKLMQEVAALTVPARAARDDSGSDDARRLYDVGAFVAGALTGRSARDNAPALPERPVLDAEVRTTEE